MSRRAARRRCSRAEICGGTRSLDAKRTECETARTAADEPFMLIYTSGTTGRPKGAVHTHCGFPIKAAQDLQHGFDMHAQDTLFWVTDMGWMMGPWELLGATILGATIVLYDGAIDYPSRPPVESRRRSSRVGSGGVSNAHPRLDARRRRPWIVTISHRFASSDRLASRGIPIRGTGCLRRAEEAASDHQLLGRNRDLGGHPLWQRADPDEAVRFFRPSPRH